MSYDIELTDPVTGQCILLEEKHDMRGGTYCLGGTREACINITYNYAKHFDSIGNKGIRSIYGMTGAESLPILKNAASILGDDIDDDYWKATEGNAKIALHQLIALAQLRPDGVWKGD